MHSLALQDICIGNLFKIKINCIYDVYKWLDDVDVEEAVLRISIVIWQTQSDMENL